MLSVTVAMIVLAFGDGAKCDCMPNEWAQVVERTERRVMRKKALHIPKDPLGTHYPKSCVRLVFNIDKNGLPMNIIISHSSNNRILDRAAISALKNYRFKPLKDGPETLSSLVFWSE